MLPELCLEWDLRPTLMKLCHIAWMFRAPLRADSGSRPRSLEPGESECLTALVMRTADLEGKTAEGDSARVAAFPNDPSARHGLTQRRAGERCPEASAQIENLLQQETHAEDVAHR